VNKRITAIVSAVVAAVTAGVLIASMASAAGDPYVTSPYPSVSANTDVCKPEKTRIDQAQIAYNLALTEYNRELQLFNRGASTQEAVDGKRKALDNAALALSNAQYAYATCQNNAAAPADKDCVNLALELNRLIDELAITKDLEALAKANYDRIAALFQRGAASRSEYDAALAAYQQAQLQTQYVQQRIDEQRKKTTDAGCTNVDRPARPSPSESPTPTPTQSSPTPTPTSTTPTPTGTTPYPTPTDTYSTPAYPTPTSTVVG